MRRARTVGAAAAILAFGALFAQPAGAQGGEESPTEPPRDQPLTEPPRDQPPTSNPPGDTPSLKPPSTTGPRDKPTAELDPATIEATPEKPTLVESGSATPTPVLDGDIENVPNLTDLELATVRITISAHRAQTNVSVAPFLIAGSYTPIASEIRLGISADSDGAFGVGASVGLNQPRMRLFEYAKTPAFCEPNVVHEKGSAIQALDAEIEVMIGDICGLVATTCAGSAEKACQAVARECAPAAAPVATSASASASASAADKQATGAQATDRPVVPPVLRLTTLIRRTEALADALKEPRSPPSPPTPPAAGAKDENGYLAALTAYIQAATAFQGRTSALASIRLMLPGARALRERREKVGEEADIGREEGLVGERQLCRLEAAYRRSSLLNLSASVSFFPLYFGPDITPPGGSGQPVIANAHSLRRFDVALAYRFYGNRRAAAQLRGGFRTERGDPSEASQLLWRALAGADLGFFASLDDTPDEHGFERGIGFGLSGTAWFCGTSGGCVTDIGITSPYAGGTGLLPLSRRIQLTGFVEWRQAVALNIRAGVEARLDSVVGRVPGGDPRILSPMLTRIIPTLALGSSFWGL